MRAVHVQHPPRARALVQIVDILRDDQQLAAPFALQPRERMMRRIGLFGEHCGAAHVVEALDQLGIAREALGRGDILHPVPFPQPAAVAKGVDPAFGGDSRPGQDDDIAQMSHVAHEACG